MPQRKVLVIEDDRTTLDLLSVLLARLNVKVDLAEKSDEAMVFFRGESYDLVITDLDLPGKNGNELIREFKSKQPLQTILVASAEDSARRVVETMRLGIYDYIVKPIDPEDFISRVRRSLEFTDMQNAARLVEKERAGRLEYHANWNIWKEEAVSGHRNRFNISLFNNMRHSFNQGVGFGGMVSVASMISEFAEKNGDRYLLDSDLFDLLKQNAEMAGQAMHRFEEIDRVVSEHTEQTSVGIRHFHHFLSGIIEELNDYSEIRSQKIVQSEPPPSTAEMFLKVSEDLCKEAFRELLFNAMKFSETGSTIYVILQTAYERLFISILSSPVENQFGRKSAADDFSRLIFEPFFRITATVDERFPTLDYGLGLTLVERIIGRHEGRVRAAVVNEHFTPGSTSRPLVSFEIQLPLNRASIQS